MRLNKAILYTTLFITMGPVIFSCHRKYTPLPDGYFRIDPYPEEYKEMTLLSPFISFEIPDGTTATLDKDTTLHKNDVKWLNIRYPRYRATIYCSYHILHKNLESLLNESKGLVYRQSIRPDFIKAGNYEDPERKIYDWVRFQAPASFAYDNGFCQSAREVNEQQPLFQGSAFAFE